MLNFEKYKRNPLMIFAMILLKCRFLISNDVFYMKLMYLFWMKKKLNLKHPVTFNEKLQWMKLFMHNPVYTKMVDKYDAKSYVAKKIGEEHIIPTIAIWDTPQEIEWEVLPEQFVIKVTHDSGGLIICKNKNLLNKEVSVQKLEKALKNDYYKCFREWPYKDVPRKIIVEKYMSQDDGSELIDYKFYCFNGEPRILYISKGLDNHNTAHISFLTMDWQFADFHRTDFAPFDKLPPKPSKFEEMKYIARNLSEGFPFLRVDLYEINEKIYFSELTLCPCSGMMPFEPEEWDEKLGEWLKLPL